MPRQIIEKLINEHVSIQTHKEQLLLLKDKIVAYENELSTCRRKISALADVICHLESEIHNLKLKNRVLNEKVESLHNANPHGHRCRHCGSIKLKRMGGEPHKIFGDIGIVDTFFICLDCEKESVITIDILK
ncbi:hypothetical protein [Nitrosomonas communis]|uniref:Uncharacterized protein n=1 Tax=Nitrosomonas communis TaxID=44574 RepID=A0A1H2YM54_9PROT|nr:hypothetical protein [Nitrosomonas communis]SDX05609.1 hypothetical protein SAMN05421882_105321 [Nitrosomonas communis]